MNKPVDPATERLRRAQNAVRKDLILFAKTCLRIVNKEGELVPLIFNEQQLYLHEQVEKQLAETGMVRMIVPKSRRAGISTYVGARFYWKTALNMHKKALIFSHEQASSDGLFAMVENYHKFNPFAPHTGTANVKELNFDQLNSGYTVATAGARDFGRGLGFQYFHGSEVSRWPNAKNHFAGAIKTVSNVPGTEIFLESTGAGPVGEFYERTQRAMRGLSDYRVTFLPWMMDKSNARPLPPGYKLELSTEKEYGAEMSEAEYAELHQLTPEQAYWARMERQNSSSELVFRQEFPATVADVFVGSEEGVYHSAQDILRARKAQDREGAGPIIMGVDPAGEGGDRFAVAVRQGHVILAVHTRTKVDSEEGVAWVQELIDKYDPVKVFIDAGGLGRPIISRLRGIAAKYAKKIVAVNFGSPSQKKLANKKLPGPKNRRAEMQERLKFWLADTELQAVLPDSDTLQADLLSMKRKPDHNNDLAFYSKDEMRAKGYQSPDEADAVGLTFASTVYVPDWKPKKKTPKSAISQNVQREESRSWMAG